MFSHVMVGSNDLARSKAFYDALFASIGARSGFSDPKGRVIYVHNGAMFMISAPIDGQPACHANGGTIGFAMETAEQNQTWHDTGVAAGGTSIEDPPGIRDMGFGKIHLAYLRDPDGNKLCGVYRVPA